MVMIYSISAASLTEYPYSVLSDIFDRYRIFDKDTDSPKKQGVSTVLQKKEILINTR